MNILFIINSFSMGGAEKLVYDLSLQLCGRVSHISVIGLYKTDLPIEQQIQDELHKHGVKTYILNKRAKKDRFKSVRQICQIIKQDNISLVHAHCGVPMLLGKLAGLLTRVPVMCTIHSTSGYSAAQERMTSWMSKSYVSIGEAAEKYMTEKLYIPPAKITRIYNAVDTATFGHGTKSADFWQHYGGEPGDINLLHVGRVHEAKNQLCMLRAMAELKKQGLTHYKLYIVGPYETDDPLYQQLTAFVRAHQLEAQVHFVGPQRNVADFLANADCFLMTSRYEGFSLAFLEAVISGVPVICTNLDFVRNLNKIARCALLVAQDDSKALADILAKKQFSALTQNSAVFAERFSIGNCAQKHLELYKKVCA